MGEKREYAGKRAVRERLNTRVVGDRIEHDLRLVGWAEAETQFGPLESICAITATTRP